MRFSTPEHSFKNWTGSPVEPEKTRTGSLAGLLGAQDRTRHRTVLNRPNRGSTAGFHTKPPIWSDRFYF
jgi:hypothetical protein